MGGRSEELMNVVVVGCGRVGSQLATMLSIEGHNVTVIDKNDESYKRLGSTFNGVTIKGLGFDEEVLVDAGIREADAFAAVTDLDNTNLMAAEVARKLFGVKHVVARLYNPQRERTYQQLDLDYVCGTTLVAENLLEKIHAGHGHHISTIGDIEVIELEHQFRIALVSRGNTTFVPLPETVLQPGDVVLAAVKDEAFAKVERYMEG
jgi:trk system potassium uptake protein TrkA